MSEFRIKVKYWDDILGRIEYCSFNVSLEPLRNDFLMLIAKEKAEKSAGHQSIEVLEYLIENNVP